MIETYILHLVGPSYFSFASALLGFASVVAVTAIIIAGGAVVSSIMSRWL